MAKDSTDSSPSRGFTLRDLARLDRESLSSERITVLAGALSAYKLQEAEFAEAYKRMHCCPRQHGVGVMSAANKGVGALEIGFRGMRSTAFSLVACPNHASSSVSC